MPLGNVPMIPCHIDNLQKGILCWKINHYRNKREKMLPNLYTGVFSFYCVVSSFVLRDEMDIIQSLLIAVNHINLGQLFQFSFTA